MFSHILLLPDHSPANRRNGGNLADHSGDFHAPDLFFHIFAVEQGPVAVGVAFETDMDVIQRRFDGIFFPDADPMPEQIKRSGAVHGP